MKELFEGEIVISIMDTFGLNNQNKIIVFVVSLRSIVFSHLLLYN